VTITTGPMTPAPTAQPAAARSVTFIRFIIRFAEPGAVTVPGFPGRNEEAPWGRERAHLLADTDPWGRPHLPGTSLAGALREEVRCADEDAAEELFGHLLPAGTGGAEVDAQASQIWVLGARPISDDGGELATVPTGIRASTAISRTRAAASANTLRVEEVLPAGTRFEAFLRWDDAPVGGLDRLLRLLGAWRPLIGHGTSRGRGRCVMEDIRHGTVDLREPAGLRQWLTLSGPELARAVATTPAAVPGPAGEPDPVLRVSMRITGPLRTGSGEPAPTTGRQGQQIAPMFRDGDRYVLPGTGLKGLLRSRAEFILRSVGLAPLPCLDQRCGKCWTCGVFGYGGGQNVGAGSVGARALIRVADTAIADAVRVTRQHVAIDRFTGGAQDGLLFTDEVLEEGTFVITVEPAEDLAPEKTAEIRAVLRLVLEDLNDGIAGIGAGVARGYGSVAADLRDAEERSGLPGGPEAQAELARMLGSTDGTSAAGSGTTQP
jgi:CRISPR/Cas system CSM-associated protein Csm3 (group 7 of RAMP superfamily)